MGIVIGCIMLSNSLADAYAAAQGTVDVTTLHIFGFNVELVGFQGGIIVALLIGIVTAKLDQFFEKKVPEMIRLLVSPLLTTLISSFLLFLLIGPIGRGLASGITLADPTNHGYVNYVIAHLVALGVGFIATVIMGTVFEKKNSKIDSITAGNIGSANKNSDEKVISFEQKTEEQNDGVITAYANGELTEIEKVNDETFASKVLGDGIAIIPEDGNVYAPVDGEISVAIESGHAVGVTDMNGTVYLIHIGIDTVQLNGKYFKVNVQVGDQIKRGDLLVTFDKEKVEKAGFDTACMLIVTEANGKTLNKTKERKVKVGEEVAILENND